MPIYQFKCPQCQQEKEIEMSFREVGKKKPRCPQCGGKMERVYSFSSQANKCASCSGGSCPFCK